MFADAYLPDGTPLYIKLTRGNDKLYPQLELYAKLMDMNEKENEKMCQVCNVNTTRDYDGYDDLLKGIRTSFVDGRIGNEPMFTTDASDRYDLYDLFLKYIPEEARQHYTCRCCSQFVNKYGGLVTIDDEGYTYPVMWNFEYPEFFASAIAQVYQVVSNAKVTGVFVTSEKQLGTARTGYWDHMAVDVPKDMILKDRLRTPYQAAAAKKEDFKMLMAAIQKYKTETIETAVNLLRSDALYRAQQHLGIAEWFLDMKKTVTGNRKFTNILWKKSATAPAGFCHISSSVIGTLLDDIEEGYEFEAIKRRFNEKMNPLQYQRPQVAPTTGNVKRAEEIVAKLGMEKSLKRKFARLEEIKTIWTPVQDSPAPASGGVFAGIKTKNEPTKRNDIQASATTMTWEKFQRTVLPMAKKIELYVFAMNNNYAALVTAEDMDAPPIVQWDNEESRNPVNWYLYNGGSHPSQWNLKSSEYTEVTGIALQPNLWQPGYEHKGSGVFFILKGCKDLKNKSSALFPETLKGTLREVRATIEAYSHSNALSGIDEASACGLCLQSGSRNNWLCKLRVTTDVGVSMYYLDRWD